MCNPLVFALTEVEGSNNGKYKHRKLCQYFRVCEIQKLKIYLIVHYSNAISLWKGVPALRCRAQNISLTKCFIVETSCYRLLLWLNFIVTVELLYDKFESDFVQRQTTMQAFASRIELDWNRIVHQIALWILVFSTTRPWNKQIFTPDAS